MADELKEIFDREDISRDMLLKYLKGELSNAERHEVEKAMIDSALLNDAVEGLQNVSDNEKLPAIEKKLDSAIKELLQKRKKKKEKRRIKELSWVIIFVVIVLGLLLAGLVIFFV